MRKLFVALIILAISGLGAIYLFIPGKLSVSSIKLINTTPRGVEKFLSGERANWLKWWPANDSGTMAVGNKFRYNDIEYAVAATNTNFVEITIKTKDSVIHSLLSIIPVRFDSVALQWEFVIDAGLNPFKKIRTYQNAKGIKTDLSFLLENFKFFAEKAKNIYGFNIQRTTVKDTFFIATRMETDTYPSMPVVYDQVKKLRENIKLQNAGETNYPMMHVTWIDKDHFETMVAIPINKPIVPSANNFMRKMTPGNILVTEVSGGIATIANAYTELDNYKHDFHLESPAIPFELMITDRSVITDTAKWITKVYYPVF